MLCTFKAVARAEALKLGGDAGHHYRDMKQALSVSIRRSGAQAIFRRQAGDARVSPGAHAAALLALDS